MYATGSIQVVRMRGCFPSFHIPKRSRIPFHSKKHWTTMLQVVELDEIYPHTTSPKSAFYSIRLDPLEETGSYILWWPLRWFKGRQKSHRSRKQCQVQKLILVFNSSTSTFSIFFWKSSSSTVRWCDFTMMWFLTATACSFKHSALWRFLTPNSTSSWVS